MIEPEEWLTKYAPGYAELARSERQAVAYFCFLWSLFEAQQLNRAATPAAIIEQVKLWHTQGRLSANGFGEPLAYFTNRYFSNGDFTYLFSGLKFRTHDRRALVEKVLSGRSGRSDDVVSALLLIVYRLRNNLFHGEKWGYGIAEQEGNFQNANQVLIEALQI
jgi:hypothetical protein